MDYTKDRNNLIDLNEICIFNLEKKLNNQIFFKFSAEIEFYLIKKDEINFNENEIEKPIEFDFGKISKFNSKDEVIQKISDQTKEKMKEFSINISDFEKEDGQNQFEINFEIFLHPVQLCDAILIFQKYAKKVAIQNNFVAIFNAKPFQKFPANGMHINISICDEYENNLITKSNNAKSLGLNSIAGLMKYLQQIAFICCKDDKTSYYRFYKPEKHQIHIHYPTNYSWGVNNRTCAIRFVTNRINVFLNRIEFRLAIPILNPYHLISGIFFSITDGILKNNLPPTQVYGNAFDSQYEKLQTIPKKYHDLYNFYHGGRIESVVNGDFRYIENQPLLSS